MMTDSALLKQMVAEKAKEALWLCSGKTDGANPKTKSGGNTVHQAEAYIEKAVKVLSVDAFLREFLRQEKDKTAIAPVAEQVKHFSETMLEPQQIKIVGFAVPLGSLAFYGYVREELDALRQMLEEENVVLSSFNSLADGRTRGTKAADPVRLTLAEKEEMQRRFESLDEASSQLSARLLARHAADQLTGRVEAEAAAKAMQEQGYLPLHLDETTMGRVMNTLALQLCIDRFNLLFQGIAEPVSQELIKVLLEKHLLPFWKEYGDGILFRMKE